MTSLAEKGLHFIQAGWRPDECQVVELRYVHMLPTEMRPIGQMVGQIASQFGICFGDAVRAMSYRSTVATMVIAMAVIAVPSAAVGQATIPGAPNLEPTRIRFGTLEYVLSILRDGEEQVIGSLIDEILPLRGDDPVIKRVQTVRRSGGVHVDSTVTDAQTLAPRWHYGVQAQRIVLLEFDGARVRGTVTPTTGAPRVIDTTLADVAFDSSNWDLAVRALPLEEGDAAILQVYDVEQQLHRYGVRVADRELRGKSFIVHVIIQLGRNNEAHVWFDDITRTLLRIETPVQPGVILRQVLKP